jgi:transposase-like protein
MVDKNPAYSKAIKELKAAKKLPEGVKLRQSKYLNNIVEPDHRGIKRLVKLEMGFGFFNAARRAIRGYEVINVIHNQNVYHMIQITLPCKGWKPR